MHMIFFSGTDYTDFTEEKENPCFPCNLYFREFRVIRARKYTLLP